MNRAAYAFHSGHELCLQPPVEESASNDTISSQCLPGRHVRRPIAPVLQAEFKVLKRGCSQENAFAYSCAVWQFAGAHPRSNPPRPARSNAPIRSAKAKSESELFPSPYVPQSLFPVAYSSTIFRRALALPRNHCLVHIASKRARIITTTEATHGTCMNHRVKRVHQGSTPT
jgi:hypothetical protein